MVRPFAVLLGLLLVVPAAIRADDVEWKAVTPARGESPRREPLPAVEFVSPPSKLEVISEEAPKFGPAEPAKSAPEALPAPRRLTAVVPPLKSERFKLVPPNDEGLKTVTLISEQPLGAAPPPFDAGRRYSFSAEFLLWFTRPMVAPPLLTTAALPAGTVLDSDFGLLGAPGTQILAGDGPIGDPFRMGARFTAGAWFDCGQTCGFDASYFFPGRNRETTTFASSAFRVLLRPFTQNNPPAGPSFQVVAFPPGFTQNVPPAPPLPLLPFPDQAGAFTIDTATGLWGAEINAKESLCSRSEVVGRHRIDAFAGFRYLDLDDRLNMIENLTLGANNVVGLPAGTKVIVNDRFSTHNQFYGGQVGARWELHSDRFVTDGRVALAIGNNHETIIIEGSQRVTPPGQPAQFFTGGLLALPSNIGRFTSDRFAFVPEVTANVGWMATRWVKLFAGYNFLYWTGVARAAEQIDPTLDVSQIPNFFNPAAPPAPAPRLRPVIPFQTSGFWAQGVQVGIEIRW